MKAILANQCRIAIMVTGQLGCAPNMKKEMGALGFAKKITNHVAQHVQWMHSGPSCPSDTDEQADEKLQTPSFEFWSLLNDKN